MSQRCRTNSKVYRLDLSHLSHRLDLSHLLRLEGLSHRLDL